MRIPQFTVEDERKILARKRKKTQEKNPTLMTQRVGHPIIGVNSVSN
jgi:hypothetical protein